MRGRDLQLQNHMGLYEGVVFFCSDLEVLATDINPVHLDRAGKGIYPASSLKEATKKIHSKFK